jgi:protoheme IX farnesyltransferase
MTAPAITAAPRITVLDTLRAYIALTKPAIISLLLITTVPAMVVAADGWPGTWLVIATILGGSASAAGANVINCWYDRDIDAIMRRTSGRPLVRGVIPPTHALSVGVALGAGAFAFLLYTTTPMAAVLALSALLFYVFVYTIWLKRRTPQNIVIGGAAGAFPPAVGWAAVSGDITLASALMFGIIFLWTPPHFWALALRLKDDYSLARVPMLPVVAGPAATRRQILLYSIVLVVSSLALVPVAGLAGIYALTAAATGAWFIWKAYDLARHPESVSPMELYKYSLLYLAVVFVAMGIDTAVF